MGRITPFTKDDEEALSMSKGALELIIRLIESKLHSKVSALVEIHEDDKNANIYRGEIQMLRTLRIELTSLKNKTIK